MNIKNVTIVNSSCWIIKSKESIALKATWNYLCNVVVVSYNNKMIIVFKRNEEDEWFEYKVIANKNK